MAASLTLTKGGGFLFGKLMLFTLDIRIAHTSATYARGKGVWTALDGHDEFIAGPGCQAPRTATVTCRLGIICPLSRRCFFRRSAPTLSGVCITIPSSPGASGQRFGG